MKQANGFNKFLIEFLITESAVWLCLSGIIPL